MKPYSEIGWQYAEQVAGGQIPAGNLTRQACQRALRDRSSQSSAKFPYRFDKAAADRVCAFVEQCTHTQGELAGELIRLEPWQVWTLTQICGWIHGGERDGYRRFRSVYLEVPRGNGKSILCSALALYFLCADGVQGARVVCAATTSDQARIVWNEAKVMAESLRGRSRAFAQAVTCAANSINTKNNGNFKPLSRDRRGHEGKGIACAVQDELHLHPTRDLYNAIVFGAGRKTFPNSIIINITTAGDDLTGICYEQHEYMRKILDEDETQRHTDDSRWCCAWHADDDDDWTLESTWRKANPNYGIAVDPGDFYNQFLQAQNSTAARKEFLTKKLCRWVDSKGQFFDMLAWKECQETKPLTMAEFRGQPAYIGVDGSNGRSDLAAMKILIPRDIEGKRHYYCFTNFYLSAAAIKEAGGNAKYPQWVEQGHIKATPGNDMDFDRLEADIRKAAEFFEVRAIAFDPYLVIPMIHNLQADGLPVKTVRQNIATLSEPTKHLDSLTRDRRFHFHCPVLYWCASNTEVISDGNGNIKPVKDSAFPHKKNDGVMAVIDALASAMQDDQTSTQSVYERENRGFHVFG